MISDDEDWKIKEYVEQEKDNEREGLIEWDVRRDVWKRVE